VNPVNIVDAGDIQCTPAKFVEDSVLRVKYWRQYKSNKRRDSMENTIALRTDMEFNFDWILNHINTNPILNEVKSIFEHYKRVGKELLGREVSACLLLKSMGFGLLKTYQYNSPCFFNRTHLDLVTDKGYEDLGHWTFSRFKDYDNPIPVKIIEDMPTSFVENSFVFSKAIDPIIACPLGYKATGFKLIAQKKKGFWRDTDAVIEKRDDYPGPYWAALYRWE